MYARALRVLVTSPRPISRPSAAVARFVTGACDRKETKAHQGFKVGELSCSASSGMGGGLDYQGSAPGESSKDGTTTVRIVIRGKVQGVFYRKWTAQTAENLGVRGWVRNRHDGSVEAVLSGEPDTVDFMVHKCRSGPPSAVVTGLVVEDWPHPVPASFEVKPTAS